MDTAVEVGKILITTEGYIHLRSKHIRLNAAVKHGCDSSGRILAKSYMSY